MKYNIIYADPPWTYTDKARAGDRGVEFKYPTMNFKDISNLPVKNIAEDHAVLFLWATMPLLPEIIPVMTNWGFSYKTVAFTWVKRNKKALSWFWGMGNWTRSNAELCLLGVRGKIKRVNAGIHSIVEAPIGQHSSKPDEVRDRIVQLMGDIPRVELFARETDIGWDSIGYDINGKDIREVIK